MGLGSLYFKKSLNRMVFLVVLLLLFTGCDSISHKLSRVGKAPELDKVNMYEGDYVRRDIYPELYSKRRKSREDIITPHTANSLWLPSSRTLFRAGSIGDIISVKISVQDKAQLDNKTEKGRNTTGGLSINNLFGLEKTIDRALPSTSQSSDLVDTSSKDKSVGSGKIDRQETINTVVAATVVDVLPSGNLFISGSQEVRVNFELREITVRGIIRPEDIANDNSVMLSQIAEARVSYGGRGTIMEYQQDRYGKQIVDAISPF